MPDRMDELAKASGGELMNTDTGIMSRPAFINPQDKFGTESITKDDLRFPRLGIAQGLSHQMIPGDPVYIDGLRLGEMFNDLSNEIYGRGPLTFIPLRRDVVRIEFDPNDGTKVLDRDVPANDPRMFWDGDEPPKATKFTEFISVLIRPDRKPEPIVISIKETNKHMRRAAERLTGYVRFQDGPIYAAYKTVEVAMEKNDKGTFGVFVFKNKGFIQDERMYRWCEEQAHALEGKVIDVQRDSSQDFDRGTTAEEEM